MVTFLMWVLVVHLIKRSSQMDCKIDILKNTALDCKFQLKNAESSLQCESIYKLSDFSDAYFVIQLYSQDNNDIVDLKELFVSFLSSTFNKKSRFYKCDSIWRDFIAGDPALLSENCKSFDVCVQQASNFINGSSVKRLEIYNTGSALRFEGLHQFPEVVEVNIHDNHLVNISELNFDHSSRLSILTLIANNFQYLPSGIFGGLQELEYLDLSQNKIRSVTKLSFGMLENLKSVNLSFNSIKEILNEAFTSTPNLKELYLMNNKLIAIDEGIFRINKYLTKLDLSNNNLKHLPAGIFHGLQNLEQITCSQCKLTELESSLFRNLTKLTEIVFSKNEIKTVPNDLFLNQHFLFRIDLSYNRLSEIPVLKNKTYLKFVNLFQNEISSIDENLSFQAPELYYFKIGRNRLNRLTDDHVKNFVDLEFFDLSYNNITSVELGALKDIKIRKLMLQNNFISVFKVEWRKFNYLEELNMTNNQLTHLILPPCIPSVKRTITFHFQHNKIARLDVNTLIKEQRLIQTDLTTASGCFFNGLSKNFVDISHNPLICDCTLYPFYNYVKHEKAVKLDTFLNIGNLTCFMPKILQNASIFDLAEDAFSCSFRENCPELCTCGIRGKDNHTFVNCSGIGLDKVPRDIPLETTVLYFNQNNLEHLSTLNNSRWDNLVELHADYNNITTLKEWNIPRRLQYLSLKGNKIKSLPQELTNFISNQTDFELYLGGNDRNCECSRKALQEFIVENVAFVKDVDDILCEIDSNGTTSLLPLYTILDEVLCSKKIFVNFNPKVTIISMSVVFTLLLSILLFYYKQRQLILSFLYIYCNEVFHVCFEENEADDDKVFDAFVAYSSFDRQIVMDILQELEEKEPHFQLCIHERNWLPGRFISDNIISSVQNSKRTIVILSNNFIASPWFRLELRAAIFKVSGDRKNKIIVILADKSTSLEGIDTELRHVISKRTYLVWGERWFWEKLRYAMPRKSCLEDNEENNIENVNGNKRDSEIALMENI